jgi:hypothetical protein
VPHVAIANVIGTIGLLALLGIVLAISSTLTTQYSAQGVQTGLQEVALYASNQLVSMATLTASSQKTNLTAYKVLDFPSNLGFLGYTINLTSDSSGYKVMAYLDSNPRVNANASLNFPAGIQVLNSTNWTGPTWVSLTESVHSGEAGSLYRATLTAVIVFQSVNGVPYVGLGVSSHGRNL